MGRLYAYDYPNANESTWKHTCKNHMDRLINCYYLIEAERRMRR